MEQVRPLRSVSRCRLAREVSQRDGERSAFPKRLRGLAVVGVNLETLRRHHRSTAMGRQQRRIEGAGADSRVKEPYRLTLRQQRQAISQHITGERCRRGAWSDSEQSQVINPVFPHPIDALRGFIAEVAAIDLSGRHCGAQPRDFHLAATAGGKLKPTATFPRLCRM